MSFGELSHSFCLQKFRLLLHKISSRRAKKSWAISTSILNLVHNHLKFNITGSIEESNNKLQTNFPKKLNFKFYIDLQITYIGGKTLLAVLVSFFLVMARLQMQYNTLYCHYFARARSVFLKRNM